MEGNTSAAAATTVPAGVFMRRKSPLVDHVVNCIVNGKHYGLKTMLAGVGQNADACVVLMLACELAFQDGFKKVTP